MAYGSTGFSSFPLKYLQINTHNNKVKTNNHILSKDPYITL